MKRIVADSYDKFWDLHESDYETGSKLEDIIEELGYTEDFFPENGDDPEATDEQYDEVLRKYHAAGGSAEMDDAEVVEKVVEALSDVSDFDSVRTFDDAGVLTKNYGVIVSVGGKDYQFELLGSWH